MAAINNDDVLVISYGESIANFGAAYAATQESVKTQGLTIATLQGQVNAMQQYCIAVQQQPPRPSTWLNSSMVPTTAVDCHNATAGAATANNNSSNNQMACELPSAH
jgi:hypothetical protein